MLCCCSQVLEAHCRTLDIACTLTCVFLQCLHACNAVGQPWLGQSTALPRVSAIRTSSRITSETAEVRETPRLVVDKLKVSNCLQGGRQQ
jgi:hypothetical protein